MFGFGNQLENVTRYLYGIFKGQFEFEAKNRIKGYYITFEDVIIDRSILTLRKLGKILIIIVFDNHLDLRKAEYRKRHDIFCIDVKIINVPTKWRIFTDNESRFFLTEDLAHYSEGVVDLLKDFILINHYNIKTLIPEPQDNSIR